MNELYIILSIKENPIVFGVYDTQEQAVAMYNKWKDKLEDLVISTRYLNKEF